MLMSKRKASSLLAQNHRLIPGTLIPKIYLNKQLYTLRLKSTSELDSGITHHDDRFGPGIVAALKLDLLIALQLIHTAVTVFEHKALREILHLVVDEYRSWFFAFELAVRN
jgi:hypothetical protein